MPSPAFHCKGREVASITLMRMFGTGFCERWVAGFASALFTLLFSPAHGLGKVEQYDPQVENIAVGTTIWDSLDLARQLHLKGEGDRALQVLQRIAQDTAIYDENVIEARRELTAFVLYSTKDLQGAFDTLQKLQASSKERWERTLEKLRNENDQKIDSLRSTLALLQDRYAAVRRTDEERWTEYFSISTILIAFLLIVIVLLMARGEHRPLAASEPGPTPERSGTIVKEVPALHGPLIDVRPDEGSLYPHLSAISDRLNKGDTVEAAAHVSILGRYVRLREELEQVGEIGVDRLVLFIRQFLKLSSLRIPRKVHYTVDADRDLQEARYPIPLVPITSLLSSVLDRSGQQVDPRIEVKIGRYAGQDRPSIQIISNNIDPGPYPVHPELQLERSIVNGTEILVITW